MIYLGQANRYMGETCWTWGGADSCTSGGYGYGYGYVKRSKTVQEEREELGIVPKAVKKIIKSVVKENVAKASEDRAKEDFRVELQRRDIAYKQQYEQALEAYRDRMVALEIGRLIKIKQAKDDQDDEDAAFMLLM